MKISPEAREAAASVVGFHGRQIGVDAKIRAGKWDDHPLAITMQSLINSTLERAAGVALARANHAQRLIEGDDVTNARVAFMMCAELIEKEIRQLMDGE